MVVDKDHPVESFRPIARATVEESHRTSCVGSSRHRVETARAAVEEGADVWCIASSTRKWTIGFVQLLKVKHIILTPTTGGLQRYGRTFANKLNLTPEEKGVG